LRTKKQALVIKNPDGAIEILPMRYNASHQRGWRCFLSPLAEDPAVIVEETVPSFEGRSLFDALAMFRKSIEPAGGRLLQAMASRECWNDMGVYDRFCRRLALGSAETELIDGFLPIDPKDAATLHEQRAHYEAWRESLPPMPDPGAEPRSRGRRALDQSNAAVRAAREAAILSRGDLAPGEGGET
jgi:hypothetical protein